MVSTDSAKSVAEFYDIMKDSDNIYREISKQLGLSESVFWILYFMRLAQFPLTQKDICEMMYQPKQTVNSALKKLEKDGYIKLLAEDDRRKKCIVLTETGLNLASQTVDKVISAEIKAMNKLSPNEQQQLFSLFKKYNFAMKEQAKNLKR